MYETRLYVCPSEAGPVAMADDANESDTGLPPDAFEMLSGRSRSISGVRVTNTNARELGAVWQALTMIPGDIARMPLVLMNLADDGTKTPAKERVEYTLCKLRPNREMHANRFWRRFMAQALLFQNAYAMIERKGNPFTGQVTGIIPLLADRTRPEYDQATNELYYKTEVDGKLYTFAAEQVLHVEGLCLDNSAGAQLVRSAREMLGAALARQNFSSRFFKYGGRLGGILEIPTAMSKPARDNMEEGFRKGYENPDNTFKTIVLRENAKFHASQVNPDEAQMLETRREDVRDVARFFNMSPSRLGDTEGGRPYKSKSEDNRDYVDTTLSPWLAAIAAECGMKLLGEEWLAERLYYVHDTSALLALDQSARFASYAVAISSKFMSPDEVRARENMPKREDGGGGFESGSTSSKMQSRVADVVSDALVRAHTAISDRGARAAKSKRRGTWEAWQSGGWQTEFRTRLWPALCMVAELTGEEPAAVLSRSMSEYGTRIQCSKDKAISGGLALAETELTAIARSWCYDSVAM